MSNYFRQSLWIEKKEKNYRIFGIDGSDIISRFKCSNCLELIIYVDNENRKNSLLWVKFEEEVYDLYEKRELLLKEKVDDVNNKIVPFVQTKTRLIS